MTITKFSSTKIGWAAILAVAFLILMYSVDISFGKVNDGFNSMMGIASGVLALMLFAEHHATSPLMSQIAIILAEVGAIFTIIGSILIIFDFTDFVLAA